MLPSKLTVLGAVAFAMGMFVVGIALAIGGMGGASTNASVQGCSSATSIPDPTATSDPGPQSVNSLQIAPCTATSTTIRRSATPTQTATPAATKTEVPRTAVSTVVPPTAVPTKPGGGTLGENIIPPNTGTGGSVADGASTWLLVAGVLMATMGGGAVLAAVRRRS